MNNYILSFLVFLLLFGCYKPSQETATSGRLTACVSESHFSLIKKHADEFNSLYTNSNINLFGASTREAIVYFLNDSVKLIVIDRSFNKEEQSVATKADIRYRELKIAEDALAVIVNKSNKITDIPLQSILGIVTRKILQWNQLPESKLSGSIEFVFTDKNSGMYELLKDYFLKLESDIVPSVTVESQNKVFDYVAANPQAFGLVSVTCLKSLMKGDTTTGEINASGPVRALSIVSPDSTGRMNVNRLHQANIYQGTYPLHYPLFLYFDEKNSVLAAGFSSYITSAPGQRIILKSGLVPATMPIRLVHLKQE